MAGSELNDIQLKDPQMLQNSMSLETQQVSVGDDLALYNFTMQCVSDVDLVHEGRCSNSHQQMFEPNVSACAFMHAFQLCNSDLLQRTVTTGLDLNVLGLYVVTTVSPSDVQSMSLVCEQETFDSDISANAACQQVQQYEQDVSVHESNLHHYNSGKLDMSTCVQVLFGSLYLEDALQLASMAVNLALHETCEQGVTTKWHDGVCLEWYFDLTSQDDMRYSACGDEFNCTPSDLRENPMNELKEVRVLGNLILHCIQYIVSRVLVISLMLVVSWYNFMSACTGVQLIMISFLVTAVVCKMLHCWLGMSHLSYGKCGTRSRCDKRKIRRFAMTKQRQLLVLILLCGISNTHAMEQQQALLERMTSMAEAATRAAMAAEQALAKAGSGASSSNEGLSAASRILKAPDVFSGEDAMMFQQWKHQFTSWLCFGDSRYSTALDNLEKQAAAPVLTDYNEQEKEMSRKLFAVLTSYLRGKCAHIVRAGIKNKDGFKLWYDLIQEFQPTTRQRSLALAQALGAYPVFPKDKTALECILSFEQLVMQYEEASGGTYPDDLKAATLIRCCNPRLREQLQLSIDDATDYKDIRDKVTAYERVSRSWTQEQVLKSINDQNKVSDHADGPVPMEVDRVADDGYKGKGKGKQKGKKGRGYGDWAGAFGYGRGRGRGGRGNKGKGKGKQKGKSKGKKGNGKSGAKGKKGRGKVAYGQCSICYEYGHWSRDCPQAVNQVTNNTQQQQPGMSSAASTASTTLPSAKASTASTVRRIFQLGSPTSSPTSPKSPLQHQVRMVLIHDVEDEWTHVQGESTTEWVILDSGSDVSLLPSRFQPDMSSTLNVGNLHNCQGGSLQTNGTRKAELIATTRDGEEVLLHHDFIVGNVTSCLVSLGQLYQSGWTIHKNVDTGELSLSSPGDEIRIPVEYRNRSFAIKAHVRQVSDVADDGLVDVVRVVVYAPEEIDVSESPHWEMTKDGTPFLKTLTTSYVDPRHEWGEYWPYRTTLIRKYQEDRAWTVVELSAKYMDKRNPFSMIDQFLLTIGFESECETLTLLGVEPLELTDLGLIEVDAGGDVVFEGDDPASGSAGAPNLEPSRRSVSAPVLEPARSSSYRDMPRIPEHVEPVAAGQRPDFESVEPGAEIEAIPVIEEFDGVESLTIHDALTVTATSTVKLLRDACRWLGVSQAGSKSRMFERLKAAKETALRRSMVEAAHEQYRSNLPDVNPVNVPVQPTEQDKRDHEITHVPFQPWCKYCVSSRSRANYHAHTSDPEADSQREHPIIQCDFYFMEPGKEGAVVALLMVDVWSRFVCVEPLKQRNTQTVGKALVKFINTVGRTGTVEICSDNEPVLKSGVAFCKSVRASSGHNTIVSHNKTYDKGKTGVAERFVQTIRGLQKTFICQVEDAIQAQIPTSHCIVQWAASHAAWVYNRYHVNSTMKVTPFQSLNGRPYHGRVTSFAQTVFGLDPHANKYRPAWVKGVWLGKDQLDMDLIGVSSESIIRVKAVRKTGHHWDAALILGLESGPSDFSFKKVQKKITALPAPGVSAYPLDEEAEAVKNYDGSDDGYSPTEPAVSVKGEITTGGADESAWENIGMESPQETQDQDENLGNVGSGGAVSPRLMVAPLTPCTDVADSDVEIPSGSMKHRAEQPPPGEHPKFQRMDEDPVPVPKVKAARTDPQINQILEVEICHNDEFEIEYGWDDLDAHVTDDSEDERIASQGEDQGPPDVSSEKLQCLDGQAALDEIHKLHKMNVIEPVTMSADEMSDANVVDTTLVYDRRYRSGKWTRRCRIVAREFRNSATTEEHFSPTSSFASVRLLLVLACVYDLAVTALDIKDAFLMVPQQELVYVLIPEWIRALTPDETHTHWVLHRCLPGQRNAALRWHEFFGGLCMKAGLVPFPGAPTILRHRDVNRKLFANVHVDDVLLVCKAEDVEWFKSGVGQGLSMKVDGPHLSRSGSQVLYLKKRLTMRPDGILIQPNAKYVPKLVGIMNVSGRRKKGLPYHATLEAFSADLLVESELLDAAQAADFRSGLGLALYIAQDRPDIQFPVKTLSTYMGKPTVKALSALKHLASYLDGTPEDGVLLRMTEESQNVFNFWRNDEVISSEFDIPAESHDDDPLFLLECFSDSSWADCRTTRKSTTSGVIFANGSMIHSVCRTQATVALSSCEAELYGANSLMVECIYLFRLAKFLFGDDTEVGNEKVQQRLYTDSSSAMALVRRTGTGRLKHIQIRQFFLQNLLRSGVFSIHKVATKLNPADLNTKRLGGERRKMLGKLIGLFSGNDEWNDDNHVRKVRRIQMVSRQQCVRFIQLAGAALNMTVQMKGCASEESSEFNDGKIVWMQVVGCVYYAFMSVLSLFQWCINIVLLVFILFACFVYFIGPMTWEERGSAFQFALNQPAFAMSLRYRVIVRPMMHMTRWVVFQETQFLHRRFREENAHGGDMTLDLDDVARVLTRYLFPMTHDENEEAHEIEEEEAMEVEPPEVPDRNGVHVLQEEQNESEPSDPGESVTDRHIRYYNSTQDEVSDPDEWAEIHYGTGDNRSYLRRAIAILEERCDEAQVSGNYEEVEMLSREIERMQDMMLIA